MSIMYCEKHDRQWDSDYLSECPCCENEPCNEEFCHIAEARGEQHHCQGKCAYTNE